MVTKHVNGEHYRYWVIGAGAVGAFAMVIAGVVLSALGFHF